MLDVVALALRRDSLLVQLFVVNLNHILLLSMLVSGNDHILLLLFEGLDLEVSVVSEQFLKLVFLDHHNRLEGDAMSREQVTNTLFTGGLGV